jgi:malonyl-CoA/methylmalonyl-CoA synthetase
MRSLPLERPEVEQSALDAWSLHVGRSVTDAVALREELSTGSLPGAFASTARRRSGALALSVGEGSVTHGELDVMAGRAAASLARLGVVAGSAVMLVAAVGAEEIAAYLGVLRLGGTVILASPALTRSEMHTMASEGEVDVIVGSGPGLATALASGSPGIREAACLRDADRETGATMLDGVSDDVRPVEPVASDAVAILAFTSGSTGRPKPTPLSHRNLLASARGVMSAWRWSEQDHLVHSLPISHQHGLSGVHATLLAGSRASLLGSFDPETTLRTVESGASIHFGVPSIHQRLLDTLGEQARVLGRLRLAVSGSGPLPPELAARYLERTGQSLLERYGTTESGLDVSNPYEGDRAPGRVGLALPGVEMAVVDAAGAPVGEGETGEILVRGPHVFSGYLGVSSAEQPFMGGWFRTGDLGAIDSETGYLRIVGRTKDVIITGGMNVYPREVEDVLRRHPAVTDAVVVGVASPRWGEEVVALVAPSRVDRSDLARFAAEHLASYKRPKRVLLVEKIPRNSVGKTQHERLLQLIPPAGAAMPLDGIGSPPPR